MSTGKGVINGLSSRIVTRMQSLIGFGIGSKSIARIGSVGLDNLASSGWVWILFSGGWTGTNAVDVGGVVDGIKNGGVDKQSKKGGYCC
jgi:hypothetical protein